MISRFIRIGPARVNWTAWIFWAVGLFLAIYLPARAAAPYIHDPANMSTLMRIAMPMLDESKKDTAEWIAAALCFAVAILFPRFRASGLVRLEDAIGRFATHRAQAILFCAFLPVILRLALLPILRVPEPLVADEFGHLLLANTFASGRLANPAHPLWKFFEAIYVLQKPAYASIYPIAPAIFLAIPAVFGATPWLGVCLTVALMCGAICWMLQGWVPPKWAFLGGLLAVSRYTIVSSWMNTYWGGATAALGGALLLGALPRIMKHQRVRDSWLFGLGLALLAQSRPYEGFLFSIPLVIWLVVWVIRSQGVPLELRLNRVVLPLSTAVALLVTGTAFYNWQVTGGALRMPYVLHQKMYGMPQTFYWQAAILDAPGIHRQKDIEDVFQWQLDAHEGRLAENDELSRLKVLWSFYLQPLLSVPLFFFPFLWRNTRLRIPLLAGVTLLVGNRLYPFFFPHYAAPLCGLIILLVVLGLWHLRLLRVRSYRVGGVASRGLVVMIGLSALSTIIAGLLTPWFITASDTPRSQAAKQLEDGKHVVFVRYGERHSFHKGIVFNDANIDRSRIVWARDLGDQNKELIQYYPDRDFWLYNPDVAPDALTPLTEKPYISGFADGAGRRDDLRRGISPGSIAVLMGGNFAPNLWGTEGVSILDPLPIQVENVSAEYGIEFVPRAHSEVRKAHAPVAVPSNLSVQFDGRSAAILHVSNFGGQESIVLQVPFDAPIGSSRVQLRVGDAEFTKEVEVLPATPGIFQMRMSDAKLRGVVVRRDGSLVDLEHPARRGDTLRMFTTGLGPMNPPVTRNQPGSLQAFSEPAQPLIVGVANRGARMISSKYSGAMVGVVEIEFEVPLDTPFGPDVPLSVAVVVDGKPTYSNKSSLPVE